MVGVGDCRGRGSALRIAVGSSLAAHAPITRTFGYHMSLRFVRRRQCVQPNSHTQVRDVTAILKGCVTQNCQHLGSGLVDIVRCIA